MLCHQLMWSRFVNTVGRPGCNIPADLHMEHLNRSLKHAVSNLGSNKSQQAITRVWKALGTLVPVVEFLNQCVLGSPEVHVESSHSQSKRCDDVRKMANEIRKNDLLLLKDGTCEDLLHSMKYAVLQQWIYERVTHANNN